MTAHQATEMQLQLLESLHTQVCKTKNYSYTYGTAGFRDKAAVLDTVMFTTGIIAALRSMSHNGKAVGVMITASHNPPLDNGVKIIEPDGSMLLQSWESHATQLANIAANDTVTQLIQYINEIVATLNIDSNVTPSIVVGMDSRESSPRLMDCLLSTLSPVFMAKIVNHNMLTTPQLHFLTAYQNNHEPSSDDKTVISVSQYDSKFQTAFKDLMNLYEIKDFNDCFESLVVDCANGIGAPQFQQFVKGLPQCNSIKFVNDDYTHPDTLNNSCGADFVKTQQRLPAGVDDSLLNDNNLYCSFDGDADRIVFYYVGNKTTKFHLLDGDKIATLFAKFLKKLLIKANLTQDDIRLGIVQTAYANGSSTTYVLDTLHCPASCTKTGVKHLHHEAQTAYDIGIYFEANGHGTILFSDNFYSKVQERQTIAIKENDLSSLKASKTLLAFSKVINQTVGDAIADLLGVVATLLISKMKPSQWDNEYTDLPNLLSKVIVPDRTVFKTTDQERKLTSPPALQPKMDLLINKIEQGRAFVRASGTEDAVRVYCEGKHADDVKQLSKDIEALIMSEVN
ncbi:similar to Saccharomyces cerevisiae YEL058W PCM1 Essential N-acetylglucosamine-phosphate mutase [Maudiozyma barnettii]|uniref:Phosphoacetylglucosamine mutase n=1 Tax=Maudiozyma barnettii TaxID=61262 RepID=A0A8H2VHK5_9SACH|nr:phosphoacetylglucosamine mutase PCM1 [Kazachstania barnettii]CAB4255570.1 similar to Saccharomyces cerevisiae YEL058W PCM1 Essential N-acetylglucosamine-phosphate mutase [Kazachstania barnettii]CAD1784068.1 similar to Saccharomyces cerevisiae YEL058W PCM1 Essential N-acetylglucosamine-phosphate mutase [Kazachstania barnettii]